MRFGRDFGRVLATRGDNVVGLSRLAAISSEILRDSPRLLATFNRESLRLTATQTQASETQIVYLYISAYNYTDITITLN